MQVRIIDVNQDTGHETPRGSCRLSDYFHTAEEYAEAYDYLAKDGRFWTGGGASPLVLLLKLPDDTWRRA